MAALCVSCGAAASEVPGARY
ncbi:hypothetical protein J1605_005545 [Eschrichtius robustus]|uniref:Uncharacterized protein n=1 Tax=Eschrichtius robustus TaxID=9764 RepID=A0AB34H8X6_ESCRO|nr:hypothetical protein J1605_005545 [Eschrichtius robustus]